jgi:hypothetical protein
MRSPTPMMQKSLLYNLIKSGDSGDAYVDPRYLSLTYSRPFFPMI